LTQFIFKNLAKKKTYYIVSLLSVTSQGEISNFILKDMESLMQN